MIAFVTGASHGIGREIAKVLAKAGYDLAINSKKDSGALEGLKNELIGENPGIEVTALKGDIGDPAFVKEAFESIDKKYGKLDVLVNNAGRSYVGLLQDMSEEDWQELMAVNLDSLFYTCKYAIPLMLANEGGRILNVSSVWGKHGASCEVAYSASKGGVNAFTKALAKELAPSNIAVNAISPGCVDTRMNDCFDSEEKKSLCNEIPAGRFASPAQVAEMALSIIKSDPYLTGQIITFDGGWYL